MLYAINRNTKEHVAAPLNPSWYNVTGNWYLAYSDDEGFISWAGGECPLPEGCKVDVKLRNGNVRLNNYSNHYRRWTNCDSHNDIIAYRPVMDDTPTTNHERPEPSGIELALCDPNHPYHELAEVLEQAFQQAAGGKGKERHANDLPFTEQRMQSIARGQGHTGGLIYQVCKKAQESERLPTDAALHELLGVIVYAAGTLIYRREHDSAPSDS